MFLKRFSSLMAMMALLLVMAPVSSAIVVAPTVFSDVPLGHDSYSAIDFLKESGVLEGYSDGTFKPENTISRAEFLKIAMFDYDFENASEGCFEDVKDEWFEKYVCKAFDLGFVSGYPDGTFRPSDPVSFAEASKIIAYADLKKKDLVETEDWYEVYVAALSDESAVPVSVLAFDQDITRAEMAEMIWRIQEKPKAVVSGSFDDIKKIESFEGASALESFGSCSDLETYLADNTEAYATRSYDYELLDMAMPVAADASVKAVEESVADTEGASSASDDYSSTNVQVLGVDEADYIKNDGEYIYNLNSSSNKVEIVKAYPADEMSILDGIKLEDDFSPENLYLDGDTLVVLGSSYENIYDVYPVMAGEDSEDDASAKVVEDSFLSYYDYSSLVKVYIYDVSDPAKPVLDRWLAFDGYIAGSRKVDDRLYLITEKSNYMPYYEVDGDDWAKEDAVKPLFADSASEEGVETLVGCSDVLYHPGGNSTNYLSVIGINVKDDSEELSREVVLGSTATVYSSKENMYLTEADYSYFYDWEFTNKYDLDDQTIIHKFALGSDIDYKGKASVPGKVLNQFSMDEYDGNFRIATTIGEVWDHDNPSTNNLYVLNKDLERVGAIEGIAPGEEIKSVRFMGEKGYIVTFKKVDPLFVLDLADPSDPKILGKLKIPGFSSYLHPFDENHIVGFGLDTVEASEEEIENRDLSFAWYQGVKVAIFDVSDVENPVEMDQVIIGDRGTTTPLSYDHKALWFDSSRGVFAFPVSVSEISEELKNNPDTPDNTYGDPVYQGAYFYDIDLENGLELRGRISHYEEDEIKNKAGDYWYGDDNVDRIIRIGETVYTVSRTAIKASELEDLTEVNKVEFSEKEGEGYDWYTEWIR